MNNSGSANATFRVAAEFLSLNALQSDGHHCKPYGRIEISMPHNSRPTFPSSGATHHIDRQAPALPQLRQAPARPIDTRARSRSDNPAPSIFRGRWRAGEIANYVVNRQFDAICPPSHNSF
jgi:hypothetical protein